MLKSISQIIFLVMLMSGCTTTVEPYDYTALKESAARSILVIPPMNNSVEVTAPYSFLSTITAPLAESGYYVYPAEMNSVPLEKIDEIIGADAVLYVSIDDWGQKYNVLSSVTVVKGHLKLVSVKTGGLLWDAPIFAQYNPNANSGGGLVGALVGAVVSQIAGEITDNTPLVSRMANNSAINAKKRGLLYGPYKVIKEKQ